MYLFYSQVYVKFRKMLDNKFFMLYYCKVETDHN